MRCSFQKILVPAILSLAVSGCGGSSGSTGGGGGGGNPTTVTVKFNGTAPTAVATQIGTGSFTAATPASGTLTLSIPSATTNFAVAYVCLSTLSTGSVSQSTETQQFVIEASTLDGTSFSQACPLTGLTGSTGTLTGAVDASSIPGANFVSVEADNGSSPGQGYMISGTQASFSKTMPEGTDRVAVAGYVYTPPVLNGAAATYSLEAVRNFDGVAVPGALNGGNTVTLGASDEVSQQTITYKNVASGLSAPTTLALYGWSAGGGIVLSSGEATQYPSVPAAAAESGDYYTFLSNASMVSGSGLFQSVWANATMATAGPLLVTFPAPWSYSGPTPAAKPVFDMSNSGITGTKGLTNSGELLWYVSGTGGFSSSIIATGNFLNGSTTLTFPDLSGLTGFVAAPSSGADVEWSAIVSSSSAGSLQSSGLNWTASGVQNSGSFTVP